MKVNSMKKNQRERADTRTKPKFWNWEEKEWKNSKAIKGNVNGKQEKKNQIGKKTERENYLDGEGDKTWQQSEEVRTRNQGIIS